MTRSKKKYRPQQPPKPAEGSGGSSLAVISNEALEVEKTSVEAVAAIEAMHTQSLRRRNGSGHRAGH